MLHSVTSRALLVAVLCLSLIGCSQTSADDRIETLHLPGVSEIIPVYDLLSRTHESYVNLTGSLMLRDQDGAETPYVALANGHNLYAIRPNGADLHIIATDVPCDLFAYSAGFSPDSQWFACAEPNTLWLAFVSSGTLPTPWHRLAEVPTSINRTIAWSADGQQLIVTSFRAPCAAYVYQISPAHDSAQLVQTLAFPSFAEQSVCKLTWAGWSPDGQYLAVSHLEDGEPTYYVVSRAQLPLPSANGASPLVASVPAESMKRVAQFGGPVSNAAAWSTSADALIVNKDLRTIVEVHLTGESPTVLLTVPIAHSSAHLCTIGSIAKSRLIAFTYCFHQIPDLPRPISGSGERLFVFDPLASQ